MGSTSKISLPSTDEFKPFVKMSLLLSKHLSDVMYGEMTADGSAPCRIVSFHALVGLNEEEEALLVTSLLSYCFLTCQKIMCVCVCVYVCVCVCVCVY